MDGGFFAQCKLSDSVNEMYKCKNLLFNSLMSLFSLFDQESEHL